jgi:hypothetical protein
VGEQPTLNGGEAAAQRPVPSRGAGKRVKTTPHGLSTQLKIGIWQTSRAPDHAEHEVPSLCPSSATRLQLAHRRDVVERGCRPAAIPNRQLATEEDLDSADDRTQRDDDGRPETRRSWA